MTVAMMVWLLLIVGLMIWALLRLITHQENKCLNDLLVRM